MKTSDQKVLSFLGHSPSFPSYRPQTAWLRHGPFATWLTKAAAPKLIVELGSHYGYSYFAFCQAVKESDIGTRCYAIDTWEGDDHAGFYNEPVFQAVQKENRRYQEFSTLVRKTFDDALEDFEEKSIDVLHIDGRHGYDDVKHDYESWASKLSPNSIVLFHDTTVDRPGFGVKKFWAEIESTNRTINFHFQHGLGVLFIGNEHSPEINDLINIISTKSGRDACESLFFAYSDLFLQTSKAKVSHEELTDINKNISNLTLRIEKMHTRITKEPQQVTRVEESLEDLKSRLAGNVEFIERLNSRLSMNLAYTSQAVEAKQRETVEAMQREIFALRRKPMRALKDLIRYKAAKKLAHSALPFSKETRERLLRSAEKRAPMAKRFRYTSSDAFITSHQATEPNAEAKRDFFEAGLLAFSKCRAEGFRNSFSEFKSFLSKFELVDDGAEEIKNLLFLANSTSPSQQGPVILPNDSTKPIFDRSRAVVYTALFGNYDKLPAIQTVDDGVEYVCFTDRDIEVEGWKTVYRDPPHKNNNLAAKYFKVHPHELFPDKDFSLFVDANTVVCGRVGAFIDRWLAQSDFAMWRHPDRDCAHDEAEAIILSSRAPMLEIVRQMAAYENAGIKRKQGLYECSFLWRKHHEPAIKDFMESWWSEINEYTNRDQTSFYFLSHGKGPKPAVLPQALGTSRDNPMFFKVPHRGVASKNASTGKSKPRVIFLYDGASERMGSTVMRSIQLPEILRNTLGDEIEVRSTKDQSGIENSIVIVGKRLMESLSEDSLHALKTKNVAVAADPVDLPISAEECGRYDLVISASFKALCRNSILAPSVEHHLITHHADPRIPDIVPLSDHLRIGYFGEIMNTVGFGQLNEFIDYHSVSTKEVHDGWLDELPHYNAHFAVRQERDIDGLKPFTKGFIAARCGAIILCERTKGDNLYYLGDDYPFYVENGDLGDIERALGELRKQFGSPDWTRAQKIMTEVKHRSSNTWIAKEFARMVREVW